MSKQPLSARIRPGSEAAPWVVPEVQLLEAELAAAYAELHKIWGGHHVLFDRGVYNRTMAHARTIGYGRCEMGDAPGHHYDTCANYPACVCGQQDESRAAAAPVPPYPREAFAKWVEAELYHGDPKRPSDPKPTDIKCTGCGKMANWDGASHGWALCHCGKFRHPGETP